MTIRSNSLKKLWLASLIIMILVLSGIGGLWFWKTLGNSAKASLFQPKNNTIPSENNDLNTTPDRLPNIVPDQYIVKFKTESISDIKLENSQNEKLKIKTKLDNKTFLLENPSNPLTQNSLKDILNTQNLDSPTIQNENKITSDTIKLLATNPDIEAVEPNIIVSTQNIPNDVFFSSQWHLQNTGQNSGTPDSDIKAIEAWNITQGDSSVIIAIIDTGVDYTHPDLTENIARNNSNQIIGYDFANNDNDPMDDGGHGTHLAGIIASKGNNEIGVSGVCPTCKIMPLKFLDSTGSGTTAMAISAINFAINNRAKVINLSWGSSSYSTMLQNAINNAYNNGIVLVASAGNDNNTDYNFPADMHHVISVASTDHHDRRSSFSNYSNRITVSAPGSSILSTFPVGTNLSSICGDDSFPPSGDGYGLCSGTSMSAPVVAGVAGLVASRFPSYTPDQISATIMNTSDNIDNINPNYAGRLGTGRVNAFRTLSENPRPNFIYLESTIADPNGDNNFLAKAGEDIEFKPSIQNLGFSANNIQARLSTTDLQVNITQNTVNIGSLNFTQANSPTFNLALDTNVTLPKAVNFSLNLSSENNPDQIVNFTYTFKTAYSIPSSFSFSDTNNPLRDWILGDDWKLEDRCPSNLNNFNSPNPPFLHFGKDNCGDYDYNLKLNSSLYSPPFQKIGTNQSVILNFDQLLETENQPNRYDKATVKIKVYGADDSTAITLIDAQKNTSGWQNKTVTLPNSIVANSVFQIFFNFNTVDATTNNFKGWFLDNINLEYGFVIQASDIQNLNIACDNANYNNQTNCQFDLPTDKGLPNNFKIKIQNTEISTTCNLDSTPSKVICQNVLTPNSVGSFEILAILDNTTYNTGKTVRIQGQDFSRVDLVFNPDQGATAPLYNSQTDLTVKIINYRHIFDLNPTNNVYKCNFAFAPLGQNTDPNSSNWITFGDSIDYQTTAGCQATLSKTQRGNNLNFDIKATVCPNSITVPDNNCSYFYQQYFYRFEGAGVASGS